LANNPGSLLQLAAAQSAAMTIGVQVIDFGVRDAGDIDRVFGSFSDARVKAVMIGSDAITINNQPRLVELAAQYRLPAIYSRREFADAGGLIAYGPNYAALWERLAVLVDKIIRGRAPGDLPVEQPTKFDLVVNAKTAQALGMTIPRAILVQAEVVQ
jgi:putative ABC transport system substrate-binding protein